MNSFSVVGKSPTKIRLPRPGTPERGTGGWRPCGSRTKRELVDIYTLCRVIKELFKFFLADRCRRRFPPIV